MRVIFEIIAGSTSKKQITLEGHQKVTFGRTTWADYQFPTDALMSGRHFEIECDGPTCLVRDLNSSNGTYIDEERVIESPVATGAVIRAGHTKFRVTLEETEAAAPLRQTWTGSLAGSDVLVTALGQPLLFLPSQMGETDVTRPYDEALNDPDRQIRWSATLAAVWSGRKWALEFCRRLSDPPLAQNWDWLSLLAILGQPSDLQRVLAIGRTVDFGPRRYEILGAFGHPQVVKDLLIGMESKTPAIAAAAGAAFTKLTGVNVESADRVAALPAGGAAADEFDREFADEVTLPDPAVAAREWKKLKPKFAQGLRWCRGLDLSHGLPAGALELLDLESRWEACLRGRFEGTWKDTSLDREQLADRLASC